MKTLHQHQAEFKRFFDFFQALFKFCHGDLRGIKLSSEKMVKNIKLTRLFDFSSFI